MTIFYTKCCLASRVIRSHFVGNTLEERERDWALRERARHPESIVVFLNRACAMGSLEIDSGCQDTDSKPTAISIRITSTFLHFVRKLERGALICFRTSRRMNRGFTGLPAPLPFADHHHRLPPVDVPPLLETGTCHHLIGLALMLTGRAGTHHNGLCQTSTRWNEDHHESQCENGIYGNTRPSGRHPVCTMPHPNWVVCNTDSFHIAPPARMYVIPPSCPKIPCPARSHPYPPIRS